MRIYADLYEAVKETRRNLWEMGIEVKLESMQNKLFNTEEEKEKFTTKEIQGEAFSIQDPLKEVFKAYKHNYGENYKIIMDWALEELKERVTKDSSNPGKAWKLRRDIWEPLMKDGKFEYTYNERLWDNNSLVKVAGRLTIDPNNRRQVIPIYTPQDRDAENQYDRVPCSVSYSWLIRNNELLMFYHMRSCDFYNHFVNDMFLAGSLNKWLSLRINEMSKGKLNITPGRLTVLINSLHAYKNYMSQDNIF